jgi:hypothetical protein
VAVTYFLFVLLPDRNKLHYYVPVAVFVFGYFLRVLHEFRPRWRSTAQGATGVCSLAILACLYPTDYQVQKQNSLLGSITCIDLSYREASSAQQLVYGVFPEEQFGVNFHSLLYYSRFAACEEAGRDVVLAKATERLAGYELMSQKDSLAIYATSRERLEQVYCELNDRSSFCALGQEALSDNPSPEGA